MKNLLIVSPTFLPNTSADMHRVRMMIPHLEKFGWQATVLAATPDEVPGPRDPLLETTLHGNFECVRYDPLPLSVCKRFGIRNLGWRSLPRLKPAGLQLLRDTSFDCVFFSSTVFASWLAGPYWKKATGVPYVLDFQDPWLRFTHRGHKDPGHPLKAWFARFSAKRSEPAVVKDAAGIIAVSPHYKEALLERYGKEFAAKIKHMPFPASPDDFTLLETVSVKNTAFEKDNGKHNIVYIGRLGEDMVPALNALFRTFKAYKEKHPAEAESVRFHFIGTSYATDGSAKPSAIPIALNWDLLDYVIETVERIPYLEALQTISEANGILVLGSTDAAYSPSKLFPALISEKPILCIAAKDSQLSQFVSDYRVPAELWDYTYSLSNEILIERFLAASPTPLKELDDRLNSLLLAENMTARLCTFFDSLTENAP